MAKIRKVRRIPKSETKVQYHFICPGCNCEHAFDDRWKFNQDFERPTISPSFLQKGSWNGKHKQVCHSFIKNGMIQFLGDCTHRLKGHTVALPENHFTSDYEVEPNEE